jgi:ABC-type antimicrobial peptide transport system permease subunit
LWLNSRPFTVVGVAAEAFLGTSVVAPDVWVPAAATQMLSPGSSVSSMQVMVGARLRPDVSQEQAAVAAYVPLQQRYTRHLTIIARAAGGRRVTSDIRSLVQSMDPNLPILTAQTLEEEMTGPVQTQLRVAASVSGSVGIVSLLLAAIGIYGVTAYVASQRTREIGIRLALGAQRADVLGMILRQGMVLVVIGSAIGLLLAAAGSRLLTRLLFGVPPLDPVTFGGATLLFVIVGLAACYVPARRATRIDAMEALRCE